MFKKAGGVKAVNAAVFGGGDLGDKSAIKNARANQEANRAERGLEEESSGIQLPDFGRRVDSMRSVGTSDDGDYFSGISSRPSSVFEASAMTDEEREVIPERVMRGIMFLVKGLELQDVWEADALLAATRKELEREFKRDMARRAGGTLEFALARSRGMSATQPRLSMSRSASPVVASGSPNAASPTTAMLNGNGTFGGFALPDGTFTNDQAKLMATYARKVDFGILGEENEVFRTAEQAQEDHYVKKFVWWHPIANLAIFLVQLYIVIAVLIRVGFEIPIPVGIFVLDKFIIDLPMLIKMLVTLFALHDDGSGVLKFRPRDSAKAYVRSAAFYIDLLGILPLDVIGHAAGSRCTLLHSGDRCAFVAPQWNLNRLLQCRGMFDSFVTFMEELMLRADVHPSLARLVQSCLLFLVSVHVVSCMVFFLLYLYPDSFDSWFARPTLGEQPLFDQYIASFDWSSKNMVGMSRGSTFPAEEVQMIAVVFVTTFGVCIYGLLMANLSAYVERATPESQLLQTIDEVYDTAEYVGMPREFARDIIDYYEHTSKSRHHIQDVREIVEDLPEELAEDVVSAVGRDICRSVPLLADEASNPRFVLALMDSFVPVVLLPATTLFRRDDAGDSMYIVVTGSLNVLSPVDDTTVMAELGPGKIVGEIALVAQVPRTATVVTCDSNYTDCLVIDSEAFDALLNNFPQIAEVIEEKVAERVEELTRKRDEQVRVMTAAREGRGQARDDDSEDDAFPHAPGDDGAPSKVVIAVRSEQSPTRPSASMSPAAAAPIAMDRSPSTDESPQSMSQSAIIARSPTHGTSP